MSLPRVICFGEVLWDLLPSGKIPGGAPMNVAFHLTNFGLPTQIISRIGEDVNGEAIVQFLKEKEVDTYLIQTDAFYPTGIVKVDLDEKGTPTYEIVKPVAWDYINRNIANSKAVTTSKALVYGSLAARNNRTAETLFNLLELARLKVFDVNLRAPFYSKELIEKLLFQSNIVKMNDEELELIGSWFFKNLPFYSLAKEIKKHFVIDILIVTQGSKGAFVIDRDDDIKAIAAKKIVVVDTIGSGDSFLAAFLYKYLKGEPIFICLDFAAKTGALVATKRGGTPNITEEMVVSLK